VWGLKVEGWSPQRGRGPTLRTTPQGEVVGHGSFTPLRTATQSRHSTPPQSTLLHSTYWSALHFGHGERAPPTNDLLSIYSATQAGLTIRIPPSSAASFSARTPTTTRSDRNLRVAAPLLPRAAVRCSRPSALRPGLLRRRPPSGPPPPAPPPSPPPAAAAPRRRHRRLSG